MRPRLPDADALRCWTIVTIMLPPTLRIWLDEALRLPRAKQISARFCKAFGDLTPQQRDALVQQYRRRTGSGPLRAMDDALRDLDPTDRRARSDRRQMR